MQVERKYYRNYTIHRTLLQKVDDPANSTLSCGFLYKQGSSCVQKDICFKYYGGLYVISGNGVYIDAVTGKEYPVGPGCVLQRMPGKLHHTIINRDSDWLEFYFCGGAKIFETLSALNLVTDEPVFYVGEKETIFNRLLEYQKLFEQTDDRNAQKLLIEFQKLLCYLNENLSSSPKPSWTDLIVEKLNQNCKIGISLKQIANECGLGYENLRKQFPRHFGCSLEKYRIQLRINTAKSMLLDKDMPVKEVASELGYCDVYAFYKQFKQQEGISPGEFISNLKKK